MTATVQEGQIRRRQETTRHRRPKTVGQDYVTAFTVDQTPEEAFAAINNVLGWWGEVDGPTDRLGGEFTYRGGDVFKLKVTEFVPGKRVAWLVLDSDISWIKDKREWKGTRIVFDISRKGTGSEVRFTHLGLIPQIECYDVCSDAWGSYIRGSLRSLISTGKGQPG